MFTRTRAASAVLFAAVLAAGCGTDDPAPQPTPPATPPTLPVPPTPIPPTPPAPGPFAITGTVTGLAGAGLTLTSGGKTIAISENGTFTVASDLSEATAYSVAVATHPAGPHQYCSVANGAGTATAAVNNIAVSCVAAVKIAAQVTDAPIAHASVTVKVGDKFYTTIADANGMFSINIPALATDAAKMVIAEATGAGNQTHVNFANILGTLSAVVDSADANGEIDSSTNAGVNVTNVSTARYVLTVQANNGEVPTTGTALQTAERSVDATAVMNLAAAIKLIVDQPDTFQLPAGKTSILAFAQDKTAVADFIAAAPAGAIDQALTEILADTSLVPGYKAANVPGTYYMVPAAQPGFLAPQGSGLVFDADGTGEFFTASSGLPVAETFEWEVIDGIIKVRYDNPVTTVSHSSDRSTATQAQLDALQCAGIGQVPERWTLAEREYSLLAPGSLVDQVRVTALTTFAFDAVTVPVHCDPTESVQLAARAPAVSESTTSAWKQSALPDQPFTADEIVGEEWGIYVLEMAPSMRFVFRILDFKVDGTATIDGGPALDWEITESGELMLSYGDWTQEIGKLQISGDVVKTVMMYNNTVDPDQRFAHFDVAVRKDDSLLAGGAAALWLNQDGEFWHAYTNGWFPGSWNADGTPIYAGNAMTFGWSFKAGNEAWNHQFFYEPVDYANGFVNDGISRASAWHREFVWEMDAGSEEDGWIGFYGPSSNPCYGENPTVICQRRDWVPLGKSAAGYLYVQEAVQNTDDDGATWYQHPQIAPRATPVGIVPFPDWEQEGESHIIP